LRLDTDPAKEVNSQWRCRRVTLTPSTAGPLAFISRNLQRYQRLIELYFDSLTIAIHLNK